MWCLDSGTSGRLTFAGWKATSGLESHSKTNWFTQPAGETSRGRIFYNPTNAPLTVDLGSRQYLDLDQAPWLGLLTLSPFSSKILVDNGPAPVRLVSLAPAFFGVDEAAAFTLTVNGSGFTAGSVVRWDGSNRPTTFVNSTCLTAAIAKADVSTIADIPVTVYDPSPAPGGTLTPPLVLHVVGTVFRIYLPAVLN